jgi:FkbM family methyltransferase
MKSYSQLNQDLDVLKHYNNKKDGYFIEIGANNGITLSNTYLLEKEYGWKGICIEPIPKTYLKLIKNRNCICSDKAVYNQSNVTVNFTITEYDLLSGITENIDRHKDDAKNGKQITVSTITLNDLLEQNNAPEFIDYLSIDTEGSELLILSAINFDKYKFGVIHVEHNYVEPRRSKMKELLLKNNYKFIRENKWDDEYVYSS